MDSSKKNAEVFSLIAAMVDRGLRESLNILDFDGQERDVAEALRDGKSQQARTMVVRWLSRHGVAWDGESPIGPAIIQSLKESAEIDAARRRLHVLKMKLAYPNVAGRTQALEAVTQLERMADGVV